MDLPPQPVLEAALFTLYRALIYARLCTYQHTPEAARQANDFMDAIHAIPDMLYHWSKHDLAELRVHFGSYCYDRWPNGPDLVKIFDQRLTELS